MDAGVRPVGTPDCCCERVLQDLDLVAGSAGGVPYPCGGVAGGGGGGYRPSAGRGDRRAQEGDLGRGPAAGRGIRPEEGGRQELQDVLAVAAEDGCLARRTRRDRPGDGIDASYPG